MQAGLPITALAFGPGSVLAVADAGSDLQLFDVLPARHSPWSRPGGAGAQLPARLAAMPGHIAGISFNPHPQARTRTSAGLPSSYRNRYAGLARAGTQLPARLAAGVLGGVAGIPLRTLQPAFFWARTGEA